MLEYHVRRFYFCEGKHTILMENVFHTASNEEN